MTPRGVCGAQDFILIVSTLLASSPHFFYFFYFSGSKISYKNINIKGTYSWIREIKKEIKK